MDEKMISDQSRGKLLFLNKSESILKFITCFFTVLGFSVVGEFNDAGLMGYFMAILMGFGCMAVFTLIWQSALATIPALQSPVKMVLAFIVLFTAIGFFLPLSTWSSVTGMTGKGAMNVFIQSEIREYGDILGAYYKQTKAVEALIPELEAEQKKLTQAALDELQTGRYTGRPGSGVVSDSFNAAGGHVGELVIQLKAYVKTAKRNVVKAQAMLQKIRDVAANDIEPWDKMRAISTHSDKLSINLSDMDASGIAKSANRTLVRLAKISNGQSRFSNDTHYSKKQEAALELMQSDLEETADILGHAAETIAAVELPKISAIERITPMLAVALHWKSFIPQWLAAIALDVSLIFPILFIVILKAGLSEEELLNMAAQNMSFKDVLLAKHGDDMVKRPLRPSRQKSIKDDKS